MISDDKDLDGPEDDSPEAADEFSVDLDDETLPDMESDDLILEPDDSDLVDIEHDELDGLPLSDDGTDAPNPDEELSEADDSFDDGDGDDFDFDLDEDDGESGGAKAKLKKMALPAAVLVAAMGIGGFIVMNPQMLGGTKTVPSPLDMVIEQQQQQAESSSPPYSDLPAYGASSDDVPRLPPESESSVAMLNKPFSADVIADGVTPDSWQDPVGQDPVEIEMPETDSEAALESDGFDSDIVSDFEAAFAEIGDSSLPQPAAHETVADAVPSLTDQEEFPAFPEDAEVIEIAEITGAVEEAAPLEMPDFPGALEASESVDSVDSNESLVEIVPDDVVVMPPELAGQAIFENKDMPLLHQVETPLASTGLLPTPLPPVSSPNAEKQRLTEGVGFAVPPTTASPAAPDVYYDADLNVPSGPLADAVGPRKVNPVLEPASRYIVVRKTHGAKDSEALLVSANRALKLKRYEAALDIYDGLYKKNKRDPRILMGRAVAQQNTGRLESALMTYEALLDIDPNNQDAMLNMLGLLRNQYPGVALRRLLNLHDRFPEHAAIAAQVGIIQADLGHEDDALRYLGMAASLEPHNAQHLFNMAIIADRQGNKADAVRFYERALETDSVYGKGQSVPREQIYDRLSKLRRG